MVATVDSRFDDLQMIASNGHVDDALQSLLQETAP
jgi:hypothetical protein